MEKDGERERERDMYTRERGMIARECRTHGDTKWLNDSVRLPLFVDLNHANPFVIPANGSRLPRTDPQISPKTR